jgi:hypothetical protein
MAKDALDAEIEAKRREVSEARERVAALEFEVRTLERAAELRPVLDVAPPRRVSSGARSQRGGRQPGAISKVWQTILAALVAHYPDGATPHDIASFGPAVGLANLKPKDARAQAEKYVRLGYFEVAAGDRFKVSVAARERYRLEPQPPTLTTGAGDGEAVQDERIAAE